MSFIVSQSKGIMSRAIDRYAKQKDVTPEKVQLLLNMKDAGVGYFLMQNFRIEQELSIMDVLGVKVDFKGYSMIAPPFIRQALERMTDQYKVTAADLSVIITKRPDVKMYAYNAKSIIGEVTFEYLFGEDALK